MARWRFAIKPLKGQEWQIVKFSLGKFTAKYIMALADTFDKKTKYEDIAKLLKIDESVEPVQKS